MKKIIWLLLPMIFLLSGCGSKSETESANAVAKEGDVIFFWGEGCSHCETVEAYFKANDDLDKKLGIKKLEVFRNKANKELFDSIIKKCKLSQAGVPTLYKDGKCIQGDVPIIEEIKTIK